MRTFTAALALSTALTLACSPTEPAPVLPTGEWVGVRTDTAEAVALARFEGRTVTVEWFGSMEGPAHTATVELEGDCIHWQAEPTSEFRGRWDPTLDLIAGDYRFGFRRLGIRFHRRDD